MTVRLPIAGHLGLSSPDRPMLAHLARSTNSLDQIDALADHGFRGVQDLFMMLRPEAEQVAMADRMASRGLVLSSFSDLKYWNQPVWSAEDETGLDHLRSSVELSIEIATRFNGGSVVCVAGLDPSPPAAFPAFCSISWRTRCRWCAPSPCHRFACCSTPAMSR